MTTKMRCYNKRKPTVTKILCTLSCNLFFTCDEMKFVTIEMGLLENQRYYTQRVLLMNGLMKDRMNNKRTHILLLSVIVIFFRNHSS